ncbi:basement membrane-specific heparan sulfate proteoglycan core protein isoform X2 [Cotesia glomerata]|nr:basement membrane-specific heparan sulfate proteoglycan core protein isoform X2 [Cotesia glomerata]
MVLMKSAIVAILLLQLLFLNIRIVNSIEDNEIDIDEPTLNDGLKSNQHASENQTSFFRRMQRGLTDWFSWGATTADDSASTEPPKSATVSHHRELRNSEEENDENNDVLDKEEKNNDEINLGKIAAGKLGSRLVGNTDDEDLVGSGEAEGSATDETKPDPTHETESRQARFHRATLTVNEPYRTEYADTNSQDYITLSGNLTQSLKELLSLRIPNFDHVANVVQISPTEDSFNSKVTVDIGSTYPHENEIRQILEDQLHFHALGNIQIEPTGFTFRSIQDTTPECVEPTSLKCRDGSCIQLNYRCDGIAQCPDQSDELDCPSSSGFPTNETRNGFTNNCRGDDTVRCSDGSRDICSVQLCDGVPDCDDQGDENNCGGPSCSENEFSCDVSRCILDKDRCNFIQDCEDGSDERGCKYPACTQNEFRCRNGQCINSRYRCNGATECYDKSDELNCPCKEDQFECAALYCIPKEQRCDGVNHCSNGRDELNCDTHTPSYCLSGQFRCNDGHCIDGSLHCDGRSDCSDRSDERNCPVTTCNSDQFRCADGTCVSIDKRCNNINDCRNGEDESQCGCGATDFHCKDGQCIAYQLQCDGSNDCRDGSDEHDQCAEYEWRNYYNTKKYIELERKKLSSKKLSQNKRQHLSSNSVKSMKKNNSYTEFPHSGKDITDPILESFPSILSILTNNVTSFNDTDSPKLQWELINTTDSKHLSSDQQKIMPLSQSYELHYPPQASQINAAIKKIMEVLSQLDKKQIERTLNSLHKPETKLHKMTEKKHLSSQIIDQNNLNDDLIRRVIADSIISKVLKHKNKTSAVYKYLIKLLKSQDNSIANLIESDTIFPVANITSVSSAKKSFDYNNSMNFYKWLNRTKVMQNHWFKFRNNYINYKYKKNRTNAQARRNNDISVKKQNFPRYIISVNRPADLKINNTSTLKNVTFNVEPFNESALLTKNDRLDYSKANNNSIIPETKIQVMNKRPKINNLISDVELSKNFNLKKRSSGFGISDGNKLTLKKRKFCLNRRKLYRNSSISCYSRKNYFGNKNNVSNYFKKWNVKKSTDSYVNNKVKSRKTNDESNITLNRRKRSIDDNLLKLKEEFQGIYEKNMENRKVMKVKNATNQESNGLKINEPKDKERHLFKNNTETVVKYSFGSNTSSLQDSERINVANYEKTYIDSNSSECDSECMNYRKKLNINSGNSTTLSELAGRSVDSELINIKEYNQSTLNKFKLLTFPIESQKEVIITKAKNRNKNSKKKKLKGKKDKNRKDQYANGKSKRKTTPSSFIISTDSTLSIIESVTTSSLAEKFSNFSDVNNTKNVTNDSLPTYSIFNTVCSWWFVNWLWGCSLPDFIPTISEESTEKLIAPEFDVIKLKDTYNSSLDQENTSLVIFDVDNITSKDNQNSLATLIEPNIDLKLTPMTKKEKMNGDNFNNTSIITIRDPEFEDYCGESQYFCDGKKCIDEKKICDGKLDCLDGSDEYDCEYYNDLRNDIMLKVEKLASFKNSVEKVLPYPLIKINNNETKTLSCDKTTQFTCRDKKCISISLFCDGTSDCNDGSDEDSEMCNFYDYENYEGLAPCPPMDFTCGDGSCIPQSSVCDGFDDCPRAEDELNCDRGCTPTQFKCATGGKCIEDIYRCDGHPDCPDKSDENCGVNNTSNSTITHITYPHHPLTSHTNLPVDGRVTERPVECDTARTEMRCGDGKCISLRRKCDGIPDCLDNSDERDCGKCAINEWRCISGECLRENLRCDGRAHCRDGSDEANCVNKCPTGMFRCNDGICLDQRRRCDGRPHCHDGSDEINCKNTSCPEGQLPCANGICISKQFFCDRHVDCHDGSDETNCSETSPRPPVKECNNNEYTCRDRSCIPLSAICNGRPDCPYNEDEQDCHRCAKGQFKCNNGDCISGDQKCNGVIDCDDGSDEDECESSTSPSEHHNHHPHYCQAGQFTCLSDRTCVHNSARCNGIPECNDRSDESNCDTEEKGELNLKTYPSDQIIKENPEGQDPTRQGYEVVFHCRDEGYLRADVRWLRGNNLPLPPGSRDINGRLEIPNIQVEHSGPYICEAVGYPPSVPGQRVTVHLEVEKFEPATVRPPQVCKYDEATCSNGDCISKSLVCDGKFDCTDGSDEMRCNPHGCEPNQFRCSNKQCVSKIWRCDGDKDCTDGSDEENCGTSPPGSPCQYNEFKCSQYDQCIPKSYHCDMERDCQDGSDEIGCSPVYITKPPIPMVVLEPGDTMILVCTAIGVPIPEINWRLNWGHIPEKCNSESINGTGTLTCPDISVSDQGAYSCEAINIGGFVFAVPDTILVVEKTSAVCRKGTFNSEARHPDECISCFCFGVATECRSANLFTYHFPPPFDRHKVLSVDISSVSPIIRGELGSQMLEVLPIGRDGVDISIPYSNELSSYDIPYFALPEVYHGSQLKSYGGYLKYNIRYSGDGRNNTAPSIILKGNGNLLIHRSQYLVPNQDTEVAVRFFYGEWYKVTDGYERLATREDIMMTLANVENILIKAKYDDSPQLDISITEIVMDTADSRNTGLGSASYVEECSCPTGYSGYSCEDCAPGYRRRKSGLWLGECTSEKDMGSCPPGYYGDPVRNIPCLQCPCPLTNPSNQFARTCKLGSNNRPICDCPPGYTGERCERCSVGYHGNPIIPGDMCVRDQQCDPDGSFTTSLDVDGKCRCKQYATGLTCDQCKPNTFNLASKNQFGCISCFCMGITDRCVASNWFRNEIHVSFTNSIRDFSLIESSNPNASAMVSGIRLDSNKREIVYDDFPNRGKGDVYYWQLPSIFLGDQVTSYGGNLKYAVRSVPSPGGQSSKNNAADVVLISANNIDLLYYSKESLEPNILQSFTVPLLEQFWQRRDGRPANRDHLLMALADVEAIRIKATYTSYTDEAALSEVSLDTAEKHNTGKERAVEVEECSCPVGYTGLSCEDCAVGYTRASEGLYLGTCEPCNCNGHSTHCDPETGTCENCGDHTTGDNCEICEPGYQGNATQGTSEDCRRSGETLPTRCNCNPAGSQYDQCISGQCTCKSNVEGLDCNRCKPSTFGLSSENPNGCNECFCNGVSNQCHESSLYLQQIPSWFIDSHHGFTLTDASRSDTIDDEFNIDVLSNEIGYHYTRANRNRRLFWSLPSTFTGNKVKSYGGNLTLTQRFSAHHESKPLKDQDVMLIGNGITLYWVNSREPYPNISMTYTVPLRETEWRRLSTEGPKSASRSDLMVVLSNLETILVRASYSEGMIDSFISDISLDTAVENPTGNRRATQVEACRCPQGYSGTSCESCARGYYRNSTDRSDSILGSCRLCPCNDHEEGCELIRGGQVKCHCLSGFDGQYCESIAEDTSTDPLYPLVQPPRIIVSVQENKFQIVHTGSTVRYHCSGRSSDNTLLRIRWEKEGGRLPDRSLDDARGLLIIRDVKVSDSGVYICQVTDGIDVAIEKVTLTVGAFPQSMLEISGSGPTEPKAIIRPSYQQIKEGEPIEFHCEVTGNPTPEVDWIRIDGEINPEAIFQNNIWRIPAVSMSDAAEYKCIARNQLGVSEQTTVLYVTNNPDKPPTVGYDKGPVITPHEWIGSSGDIIRMVCTRSNHHSNVSWTRSSGLPLPVSASQRDGVLTINNPEPNDSGVYVCIATSYQGTQTSNSAKVSIHSKKTRPKVRVEPERQTVSQGTIAEVKCLIDDRDPELRVKWSKHGESSLGPNIQQYGNVLKIVKAQVSDRGVYICRAANSADTFEASAIIEVEPREAPILELYPRNIQTVITGGSTDLQCRVVAGYPVPEVHWTRQDNRPLGPNIEQLPGGLLRFTNISINDDGMYMCSASNQVASTSATARIEVQSPPVITITPSDGMIKVRLRDRLKLTCRADGIPQPAVAWTKHNTNFHLLTPVRSSPATPLSAVLDIVSMSLDDEGSYTCQATNAAGIIEERVHVRVDDDYNDNDVDVSQPCRGDMPCPPNYNRPGSGSQVSTPRKTNEGVRIPDDYLRIPSGGRVEIRCQVVGPDDSRIYLDWKRSDRQSLPAGSTVHNGVLSIPEVTKEAAGEYICLGLNHDGAELFRAKSHLEIISPPRIDLHPNRQVVAPGESPSITCTATGDQPLRIEWAAIGRSLPRSVSHNQGLLQFHGITYEDAGKYVCKATNDAGAAEAVAEVLVNENTYDDVGVRAVERDVNTQAGNSVRLRCESKEQGLIHWTKDGQQLPQNARVRDNYLELTRVRPEDSGRYICQIRNAQRFASDYVILHVSQPAGPTVHIEPSADIINVGDTFELRCVFSSRYSSGRPQYQWFRADRDPLPYSARSYEENLRFSDIQMRDSGIYKCRVDSSEGAFEQEYNLVVQGGENDEPAIEVKNVPYGSSIALECSAPSEWNSEKPITYKWSKLGGILPMPIINDNKIQLSKVRAEDAGTYICNVSNSIVSTEVPKVLVVTGVVPKFNQAPRSYIALPSLPDSYLRFNIEVSFKPEHYDGTILYNAESPDGTGDLVSLLLNDGYPEFRFDLGSGTATIRSNKSISLDEWHTIKLHRTRKDSYMLVDGEGPYKAAAIGRKQRLDLKEPLYVGGVPSSVTYHQQAGTNYVGFVGCISRVVVNDKPLDLIGDEIDSVGVSTCETCSKNPCHNFGVCQEAPTKNGYTCLCRTGYSGNLCDNVGESCYPGICGQGNCIEKESGYECYCPHGTSGQHCEHSNEIHQPSFHNDNSFLAYSRPKSVRRFKLTMNFNPSDNGDGILMYCSQSDEGHGHFIALVIKDRLVEFRFDIGSGMAVVRSNYVIQPGVWTRVTLNRDFKDGKLSVNGEPLVEGRAPGIAKTITLNTYMYIGGVNRSRITINPKVDVTRSFHGCINLLEGFLLNLHLLKSTVDSANIDECKISSTPRRANTILSTIPAFYPEAMTPTYIPSIITSTSFHDYCSSNPCIHGVCQISSSVFGYSCICEYGYAGINCENILKQCELLSPCKNGGSCTDLQGSYKCDCPLRFNGKDCEKQIEIAYDVSFRGDGWLELDHSVMTHDEQSEVIGFEISTNKSNGLIMWHGQTPNNLNPDDYVALAVIDGYIEYQYNLGSGPAVMRVPTQRVDDGERHRIILKRHGADGSIELNGDHTEIGVSDGLQKTLNTRGNVYLGGVPDYAMTYGKYHDGFSGCIYTLEVQDSGAIYIGDKMVRGKNVSPCTKNSNNSTNDLPTRGDLGGAEKIWEFA